LLFKVYEHYFVAKWQISKYAITFPTDDLANLRTAGMSRKMPLKLV
jgi:hypothetical protein